MYKEGMTVSRARAGGSVYGANDGCEKLCTETYDTVRDCVCGYEQTWGIDGNPVGIVYAPLQRFDNIYDLDTAMRRGTIFAELDLPFGCGSKMKGGCCND